MNAMTAIVAAESQPRWYVVRSNHKHERLARASLEAARVETYLPMMALENRKREIYGAPLFANFLFARLAAADDGWRAVFSARGVASVLGNGGRPSPLADVVIHRIRLQEHDGYVRLAPARVRGYERGKGVAYEWKEGERAIVKGGPFAGIEAILTEHVDGGRNSVLIRLLTDSPKLCRIDPANLTPPSRT